MDLQIFIKGIEMLSDLQDEEIALLAENAQLLEFKKGSRIIKRGEPQRNIWIVYDGKVDVLRMENDGSQSLVSSRERSQIFGEMSLLSAEPTLLEAVVSQPAKLLRIPWETFSRIIAGNSQTLGKFTRLATNRLLRYEQDGEARLKDTYKENADPYDLNFTSVSEPMKILVLNCGSSSLKYTLFDTNKTAPIIEGLIEKIGSGDALYSIRTSDAKKELVVKEVMRVEDAFKTMVETITDTSYTGLKSLEEIKAVGHRVVHGGDKFPNSILISDEVSTAIKDLFTLAPLHNPYNMEGIELMQKLIPSAPQVAVFDTSFHAGMPGAAHTYALPYKVCEEEHIRRYGFHGTNHKFVALSAATFLKRPLGELRIISCHLGSGASICAILHGKSVDTSMGMTPLEGLVMGTRGGDLDPGVILQLMRNRKMSIDELDQMLNKKSGLLGISGKSNDMRTLLAAAEAGEFRCENAISTFCYRVRKYIGSYMAALGGLDILIFTGGIGENSAEIRSRICQGMESFGIVVFDDTNKRTKAKRGQINDISEPGAKVRILVVPADEEKMIARETIHALGRVRTKDDIKKMQSHPIPLSTSAHHVHLSQEHFEMLFGVGRTMTPRTELSQPGQFAAKETVNLIGPKGRIDRVRILGPVRKESQVEIARTEQFRLGIDAPLRDSGDIEGTPGITIEGEVGTVKLSKGVICAKRHIHLSPEEALKLGLRDRDRVTLKIKGVRELMFGDVLVRVHPDYRMDIHLDTDEANAAHISEGEEGYIEAIQHRHYM
jgi:acetate kinase